MHEFKKIYGIDLGTTNSCIAHINKNGEPEIIPNAEGDLTTPSVVYFETPENVVVGKVAKQSAEMEPSKVVYVVKRSMGDETFSFEVDDKTYGPEAISQFILRKIAQDASTYLNEPVTDVVITCPAYFGIKEREATKNAGKLAGLTVHAILSEPTAAAFNYGFDRVDQDQTVLVFDLGGGTFDVTLIEIKDNNISVVNTGGDHNLGGKNWDDRIIDHFANIFMDEHGEENDPCTDSYTMQDLRNKAEEAKKQLSTKTTYRAAISHNGHRAEVELTREKFEELTRDLLDRTISLTRNVLEEGKEKGHPRVDQVLLVGGSTRMPMVSAAIEKELGMTPMVYDPDQAVAKGAAWVALKKLADVIAEEFKPSEEQERDKHGEKFGLAPGQTTKLSDIKIRSISSKAFGLVVVNTKKAEKDPERLYVSHILDRHVQLPAEETVTSLGTVVDNQKSVLIELMEQADGNSEPSTEIDNNAKIGEGEITLAPNLPKGSPIHVTFRLEEDGLLKVHAVDPKSRNECHIETRVSGVMSQEEVEKISSQLQMITIT